MPKLYPQVRLSRKRVGAVCLARRHGLSVENMARSPKVITVKVAGDVCALVPKQRRTDEGELDALMRAEATRLAELDPPAEAPADLVGEHIAKLLAEAPTSTAVEQRVALIISRR